MATPTKRKRAVRNTSQDITPAQAGRMYIRKEDKKLRDKPIAYTPEGKRVYAYNDNGIPVCNSKRAGTYDEDTGEHQRCRSMNTQANGRCSFHGGKAVSGVMHYRSTHLRNSDCLPSHLQGDFNRAMTDPDLLSLNHEIVMVDVQVKELKEELGSDVGGAPMRILNKLIDNLQVVLEDEGEVTEEMLVAIVKAYKAGQSKDATHKKLHVCYEMRRKLVDTAHHREKDLKTMIKADQAIALISSLAAGCREAIDALFVNLEKRYWLVDKNNSHLIDKENADIIERHAVSTIDKAHKNDFLGDVATKLGQLINKARDTVEGNPSTQTRQGNPLAIIRSKKATAQAIHSLDDD